MSERSSRTPSPQEAGAGHFRKLVVFASAAYFAALAAGCVRYYLQYSDAVNDHNSPDPMRGVQEKATLIYVLFWFAAAALALALSPGRRTTWVAFYLLLALTVETAAQACFFASRGHLYRPLSAVYYEQFDPDPFVIASPRPGEFADGVTHDAGHRRTTINDGKVSDPRLIYVFGGSTTYDVGNRDGDTWASQLSRLLGPNFAVENYGVPGFSSLEAVTQSLFALRDAHVVCALYYEGWNDLRSAHMTDLTPDYSNYEIPYLNRALLLGSKPGFLERNSLALSYAMSIFALPVVGKPAGQISADKDERLSRIYKDNIRLIAAIGRTLGVSVIFIPQIVNDPTLRPGAPDGDRLVETFIRTKDMGRMIDFMNQDLAEAAGESEAYFLGEVEAEKWSRADFQDHEHFTAEGSRKFAKAISDTVRRICR